MAFKKLSEINTIESILESTMDDYVNSIYQDFLYDANVTNITPIYAKIIYEYFKSNYIAYEDEQTFINRISLDASRYIYKYYHYFKEWHNLLTNRTAIDKRSGMQSDFTGDLTTNRGTFTKQAQTPTTPLATTDFTDEYTNYQSNTATDTSSDETRTTIISRTGSPKDILEIYNMLAEDAFKDILEPLRVHFITYEDFNVEAYNLFN